MTSKAPNIQSVARRAPGWTRNFPCNAKTCVIDFVSGRVLREIEPALTMYARIAKVSSAAASGEPVEDDTPIAEALDIMAKWFCLLFNNQFSVDDLYDGYPSDRLMHDIVMALLAVQAQATEVLAEFPTTAARERTEPTTTVADS